MATSSQVQAGLDDIAQSIRNQRAAMEAVKASSGAVHTTLSELPSKHADVIATIGAYDPATTDTFEMLAIDGLAKLTTEFIALDAGAVAGSELDLG